MIKLLVLLEEALDQKSIDAREKRIQDWLDAKVKGAPGKNQEEKTTWLWANDPSYGKVVKALMKLDRVKKINPIVYKANRNAEKYYIRFGDFPKSHKSMNNLTKNEEKGISVYPAKWNTKHNMWEILMDDLSEIGMGTLDSLICDFMEGKGRPIYLIYGQELPDVGVHDTEPLIEPNQVKIVKKLRPEEVWIEYYNETIAGTVNESVESGGHPYEDFIKIGRQQRGKAESAMLKIQSEMGGGVLNPVVEHAGDIIHRMNDPNTFDYAGYGYVKEKVNRVIWYLSNKYGFEREFKENLAVNKTDYEKLSKLLLNYANEHKKLPVFNKAQKLVQDLCILIGKQEWRWALLCLYKLDDHLKTEKDWKKFAHEGLIE